MSAAEQEDCQVADYLYHFGLSADPFEAKLQPLFEAGRRRELLPNLLQACQFTSTVLAVVGEAGVGKSSFRQALCDRLENKADVCLVDVPLLSGAEQVLSQIAGQLGVSDGAIQGLAGSDARPWATAIRNSLEESLEDAPVKLVTIENAHSLDDESLEGIIGLCESGGCPGVQFVLLGEPELTTRLAGLEKAGIPLQCFYLEALSPADLKAYLRFRLEAAGFAGVFPFKPEDLHALWELSQGRPAAVHDPAREILITLALPPPEPKALGLPVGHMVAITGLVAVLLIALFYRGGEEAEVPALTAPMQADTSTEPPGSSPLKMAGNEVSSGQQSPLEAVVVSSAPRRVEADSDSAQKPEDGDAGVSQPVHQRARSAAANSPAADASATSQPSRAKLSSDEYLLAARQAEPFSNFESQLLSRSPQHFTLQVSAAASREAVDAFVRRQPNRAELAAFSARREGQALYIVVAGDFTTAEEARSAISALPEEQRQAGPWPRSMHDVQAEIRRHRGL